MEWNRLVPELTVADFDLSLRFYVDLLGFEIAHQRESPAFAYLNRDGAQFMLEAFHDTGWNTAALERPFGRGVNFQIEVSAVQPIADRLTQAGHTLYRGVTENWYETSEGLSGQREFLAQDPDGYLLRFSQYLGEKPANHRDSHA